MQEVINEALIPMINDGLISMPRINELIYIKDFIDRVSSLRFVDSDSEKKLRSRFGVSPSIITWGDYFQTELATALLHVSEEEFTRSVDAVRYDIISSFQIFDGKGRDFLEWVEKAHLEVTSGGKIEDDVSPEDILHLKILMDYYLNLGIEDNFTESEIAWHDSFIQAEAM